MGSALVGSTLEVNGSGKHSSLLQHSIDYSPKKFYVTGPCMLQKSFIFEGVYSQNVLQNSINQSKGQCYKTFYGRKLRLFIIS
jgi:hypothetical protein